MVEGIDAKQRDGSAGCIGGNATRRVCRLGLAREGPRSIRVFDVDPARASDLVERIGRIDPSIDATVGEPVTRASTSC